MLEKQKQLATDLQEIFPGQTANLTADGSTRIHTKEITTDQVITLGVMAKRSSVAMTIKRSGTGVSIIAKS